MTIDKIEYAGNVYEFADSTARTDILKVSKDMDGFQDLVDAEHTRAYTEEQSIRRDMASSSEINAIKEDVEEMKKQRTTTMVGATEASDGAGGTVPAPLIADRNAFLRGDATWAYPPDPVIPVVTTTSNGLMSALDKQKLERIQGDADMEAYTVTFGTRDGNPIVDQVYESGKRIYTEFTSEKISQSVTFDGRGKEYEIVFEGNSVIRREV